MRLSVLRNLRDVQILVADCTSIASGKMPFRRIFVSNYYVTGMISTRGLSFHSTANSHSFEEEEEETWA